MRDPVVGFDLDLTLVDSQDAIVSSLRFACRSQGVEAAPEQFRGLIGLPLTDILGRFLPPERVEAAVADYRAHYLAYGIPGTMPLPGAADLLQLVRDLGGRCVVVSAKQREQAQAVLQAAGLSVDHVAGGRFGAAKADVLLAEGAAVFVGDHPGDMAAALAAGAVGLGIGRDERAVAQLTEAGATAVVQDPMGAADWLRTWSLRRRTDALLTQLAGFGSVVVAYSGGADSTLLLAAAVRALGPEAVVAVTAVSPSLAEGELQQASAAAGSLGVKHEVVGTNEMDRPGYRANSAQRCFHCKAELLDVLQDFRATRGFSIVVTGTNADDVRAGFRPGIAAAAQRRARTPLADAGLTKRQVRELSSDWGLVTADRPAKACLASRIRYGIEVTPFRLQRVDRAEHQVRRVLAESGIEVGDLRVRDRGTHATLEVDPALVLDVMGMPQVLQAIREAGFDAAQVDPRGFRSGALNEELQSSDTHGSSR
jgi:uncharacterized protein